jgi:hypothetical protein
MDSTSILGILAGGSLIAALGSAAEYMREKELPTYKGVIRDFLIGAVLVMFLLQIMPDSMSNIFAYLPSMKGLADSVPSMGAITGDAGPDLQLGPARF